jgi:hypothetical protein
MYHYVSSLFWRSKIPEAPPMPSEFEIQLRTAKLKHIQMGRNRPSFAPTQRQVVKAHLLDILRVKNDLNPVIPNEKKTYIFPPQHPVLIELLNSVSRVH